MELNPVLRRELRTRWRHWQSFSVIFGYGAALAVVMAYQYQQAHLGAGDVKHIEHQLEHAGHSIFFALVTLQTAAWMLITPLLTAPGTAAERASGMLEAMQLSPLRAGQVVAAKMLSALSFLVLMLLVQLPIDAVCIQIGGVSPADFGLAVLLQVVTAVTCLSLGLCCSCWSRNAMGAVVLSLAAMGCWVASIQYWGGGNSIRNHPLESLIDPMFGNSTDKFWAVACIARHVMATAVLLLVAIMGAARAFPERVWLERRHWLHRLQRLVPQPAPVVSPAARPSFKTHAQGALWRQFPVVKLLRFRNPLLQREMLARSRLRLVSWRWLLVRLVAGLALGGYYVQGLALALYDRDGRLALWNIWAQLLLLGLMLGGGVLGASAFSREREAGTWQSLLLSLLTPWQIVWAKLLAPLFVCALGSLPVVGLMSACVVHRWGFLVPGDFRRGGDVTPGIPVVGALFSLMVIGSTLLLSVVVGLWCSWLCRRTLPAVVSSVVVLLLLTALPSMVAGPGALGRLIAFNAFDDNRTELLSPYNPSIALNLISRQGNPHLAEERRQMLSDVGMPQLPESSGVSSVEEVTIQLTLTLLAFSSVALALLTYAVKCDREPERNLFAPPATLPAKHKIMLQ